MDGMSVETDGLTLVGVMSCEGVLHVLQSRRVIDCGSTVRSIPVGEISTTYEEDKKSPLTTKGPLNEVQQLLDHQRKHT